MEEEENDIALRANQETTVNQKDVPHYKKHLYPFLTLPLVITPIIICFYYLQNRSSSSRRLACMNWPRNQFILKVLMSYFDDPLLCFSDELIQRKPIKLEFS